MKFHHSLGFKFGLTILAVAAGVSGLAAAVFFTLEELRIQGPLYQDLVDGKDFIADILPPPAYMVELNMTAQQYLLVTSPDSRPPLKKFMEEKLIPEFQARNTFWINREPRETPIGDAIRKSSSFGEAYIRILREEFYPALNRGDGQGAYVLMTGRMSELFQAHKKEVEILVDLINARNARTESAAAGTLVRGYSLLSAAAALTLLVPLVILLNLAWNITRRVRRINGTLGKIAETGDLTLRIGPAGQDEVGRVAAAADRMMEEVSGPMMNLTRQSRTMAEGDLTARMESGGKGLAGDLSRAFVQLVTALRDNLTLTGQKSGEFLETSREISTSLTSFGVASEEIRATAQQMAQGSEKLKESLEALEGLAADTKTRADRGAGASREIVKELEQLLRLSDQGKKDISVLAEDAGKIAQVVSTIQAISDKVNLLSLNSTIEAARAGEAGRGFAVVAEEIRNLAREAKASAEEIEALIGRTRGSVNSTVSLMNLYSTSLTQSVDGIRSSLGIFTEIPRLTQQVTGTVGEMSAFASSNLTSNREVAELLGASSQDIQNLRELASSLAAKAQELRQSSGNFKLP